MWRMATTAALLFIPAIAVAQDTPENSQFSEALLGVGGEPAGLVNMMDTPNGVLIDVTVEPGTLPAGEHAMHIHETGDCSDVEAFESAGDHYNPASAEHGFIPEPGPHAGDMPNIVIVDGEQTQVREFNAMVRFAEGDAPLFDDDGSALVIHAGTDDYETQPSGDAGDRIACAQLTGN